MIRRQPPECQPREPIREPERGVPGWLRRHRLTLGLGVLGALVVIALAAAALWRGLTLDDLHARREAFAAYIRAHPVLSVEIYIGAYFLLVCFSLPGALIMSLAGGYLFGVVEGTGAAILGLSLGAVVMYGVARWLMGDALRKRFAESGGLAKRLQEGVDHNAFLTLLSLRLIPGLPFGLVNLAAAAVRIPFVIYLGATVLGILPSTLIYVSIGHALVRALGRNGAPKLSTIITPEVFLPLIGLFLLAAAPLAWKAWRARRPVPAASTDSLAGTDGAA